jgi:antitoxin YefM
MSIQTTYTKARANFANLCNQATNNQEIILINRRNAEDVALISASELSSLLETAHLLRSPKNAQRLIKALERALEKKQTPQTLDHIKERLGLNN